MVTTVLEDEEFKCITTRHINDIIKYLLNHRIEFDITARVEAIDFNPELPEAISSRLGEFSMFSLANYTYTTIELDDEYISFEAGFGEENFGSICYIPLYAIFQIIIDNSLLYLNPTATIDKFFQNDDEQSLNIFLNNPKNTKFQL
jgi:hypothetical protein